MGLLNWLRSIFSSTDVRGHDYIYPPLVFPQLDVKNVARRLRLAEQGAERGSLNQPSSSETAFDHVENSIITEIQGELQLSKEKFAQHLQAYDDRQSSLQLGTHLSQLRGSSEETLSNFFGRVKQGKDELFHLQQELVE